MAYVPVPKDLSKVKNKVFLNLTARQIICFLLAAIAGFPFYFLTKGKIGTDIAAMIMVVLMLPFFLFALYEKDGQPLEKILLNYLRTKKNLKVRPYKTENMYQYLADEGKKNKKKGVQQIEAKKKKKANPKS
jgi:cytosine/uracil/thiamine/allantoin permease